MQEKEIFKRPGRFSFSVEYFRQNPDICRLVFGKMLIMRAEYLGMSDTIIYDGYSFLFEESPPIIVPPEYEIIITQDTPISFPHIYAVRKQ